MSIPEPHPRPLDRRDADLLLLMFRGFRAVALREARRFDHDPADPEIPQSGDSPAA